jgi:hypothetical protein
MFKEICTSIRTEKPNKIQINLTDLNPWKFPRASQTKIETIRNSTQHKFLKWLWNIPVSTFWKDFPIPYTFISSPNKIWKSIWEI